MVMEAQIKARNFTGAKAMAAIIEDMPDKFYIVAKGQVEANDITGAKTTAAVIDDKLNKAMAYRDIADAQVKAGDKKGALQSIALAKEAAAGIEDKVTKASFTLWQ